MSSNNNGPPPPGGGDGGQPAAGTLTLFPGPQRIMNPNMVSFLTVIFQLLQQHMPHVEAGTRNPRSKAKWVEVYQIFFDRVSGLGRSFRMWTGQDGWKKFKKSVLTAVAAYADLFHTRPAGQLPSPIESLASTI